jgi:hypothetical protein
MPQTTEQQPTQSMGSQPSEPQQVVPEQVNPVDPASQYSAAGGVSTTPSDQGTGGESNPPQAV